MLDYNEFKEKLLELVRVQAEDNVKVTVTAVPGRNGSIRDAIGFADPENLMRPIVFLDSVYSQYRDGHELSACAGYVSAVYRSSQTGIQEASCRSWSHAKEKIGMAIVSRERNKDMLEGIPHIGFLDLALYCRIITGENDAGIAGTVVKNYMLKVWDISERELWEAAFDNFKQSEFDIRPVKEVIQCYMPEEYGTEQLESELPLYVLTNKHQNMGAVGMLRVDLLELFAGLCGCSWYILPSSVHEVLLTPEDRIAPENLKMIVQEVNREQVDESEQLSDEVYYYRKGSWKLEMAV